MQLKDTYPAIKETYRDRERFNGHIFLIRLVDGTTAEFEDGTEIKCNHAECVKLLDGMSIADMVNSRSGVYPPAPKPKAEPKPERISDTPIPKTPKKRGRPKVKK